MACDFIYMIRKRNSNARITWPALLQSLQAIPQPHCKAEFQELDDMGYPNLLIHEPATARL